MRVISGKAKSLRLKTIEGNSTRPTTDRIKETLFNMINCYMYDAVFIDIFAGSGGIGIEALSRGAKKAYFIDNSVECKKCIESNLKFTKLNENAQIICKNAEIAIKELENNGVVADVIFMDPPYNNEFEKKLLEQLSTYSMINEDTLIIVEASLETDFSYVSNIGFEIVKDKCYKSNKHIFLRRKSL